MYIQLRQRELKDELFEIERKLLEYGTRNN